MVPMECTQSLVVVGIHVPVTVITSCALNLNAAYGNVFLSRFQDSPQHYKLALSLVVVFR
jgi:hypothetical protein